MPPSAADSDSPCLVTSVSYAGGLFGLFSDRRIHLSRAVAEGLAAGWRLHTILPPKAGLVDVVLRVVCLVCTLSLYCPEPGETLVFERPAR